MISQRRASWPGHHPVLLCVFAVALVLVMSVMQMDARADSGSGSGAADKPVSHLTGEEYFGEGLDLVQEWCTSMADEQADFNWVNRGEFRTKGTRASSQFARSARARKRRIYNNVIVILPEHDLAATISYHLGQRAEEGSGGIPEYPLFVLPEKNYDLDGSVSLLSGDKAIICGLPESFPSSCGGADRPVITALKPTRRVCSSTATCTGQFCVFDQRVECNMLSLLPGSELTLYNIALDGSRWQGKLFTSFIYNHGDLVLDTTEVKVESNNEDCRNARTYKYGGVVFPSHPYFFFLVQGSSTLLLNSLVSDGRRLQYPDYNCLNNRVSAIFAQRIKNLTVAGSVLRTTRGANGINVQYAYTPYVGRPNNVRLLSEQYIELSNNVFISDAPTTAVAFVRAGFLKVADNTFAGKWDGGIYLASMNKWQWRCLKEFDSCEDDYSKRFYANYALPGGSTGNLWYGDPYGKTCLTSVLGHGSIGWNNTDDCVSPVPETGSPVDNPLSDEAAPYVASFNYPEAQLRKKYYIGIGGQPVVAVDEAYGKALQKWQNSSLSDLAPLWRCPQHAAPEPVSESTSEPVSASVPTAPDSAPDSARNSARNSAVKSGSLISAVTVLAVIVCCWRAISSEN